MVEKLFTRFKMTTAVQERFNEGTSSEESCLPAVCFRTRDSQVKSHQPDCTAQSGKLCSVCFCSMRISEPGWNCRWHECLYERLPKCSPTMLHTCHFGLHCTS